MSGSGEGVVTTRRLLDRSMVRGRYSDGLVRETDGHIENSTANVFRILAEIAVMEGAVGARQQGTKPAEMFRGAWLPGLCHKHYTQAAFMPWNLKSHWSRKRLDALIRASSRGGSFFDEEAVRELAAGFVHGGYLGRKDEGKLTGEWIVFAVYGGTNYYLTLGRHGEDEAIWHRAKACAAEFPELKILNEGFR